MLWRRVLLVVLPVAALGALGLPTPSVAAPASPANQCVGLRSAHGTTRVFVKPTGLGTFMLLLGQDGKLLSTSGPTTTPGPKAEWHWMLTPRPGQVMIRSTARGDRKLSLGGSTSFQLVAAHGCPVFAEAGVNTTGKPFKGPRPGGNVFGFVDAHLHITAFMRAGGLVISGEPFDRFGIQAALGRDAKVHGADGHLDYTGSLLRTASPVGTHDTHGWPTFTGWPTYNTQTHQQTYWVWLQRAWEAGERLVVAQTVDDAPLCRLEPQRLNVCDETSSIENQIRELRAMQDYIDAQYGGPGHGWFRLVYSPAEARSVIAAGKLAVIIGIESSDLFGCTEVHGKPGCTRKGIDRALARYARLGVRGAFIGHWINNALTGTALEAGAKGIFINLLNRIGTGSYFTTGRCPAAGQGATVLTLPASVLVSLTHFFRVAASVVGTGMPKYPSGLQCNPDGLTALGRYVIQRMMATHMLIEVDHMSEDARDTVLSMAERAHYPLVSSHNGTGGTWTAAELRRLYRLGGYASVTPAQGPTLAGKINTMAAFHAPGQRLVGVGIGSDTGGFSSLPAPRSDAKTNPLPYPFRSYDGKVSFARERTGTRTFDLNTDGVAHYGLLPDLLADTERAPGGRRALALLFNSAEAYLEMWQRVVAH
jgi:Membrane dipeptidase (Peptidase family M19)